MKSRRQFIQRCSSALLGAAALPAMGLAAAAPRGMATFTGFSQQVNSEFQLVTAAGSAISVVLQTAEPSFPAGKPELAHHRNFILKFTSQSTEALGDGIHTFRHPVLGALEIFVAQGCAENSKTYDYTACFHCEPLMA